eukprot:scpid110518/ scgid6381/ 
MPNDPGSVQVRILQDLHAFQSAAARAVQHRKSTKAVYNNTQWRNVPRCRAGAGQEVMQPKHHITYYKSSAVQLPYNKLRWICPNRVEDYKTTRTHMHHAYTSGRETERER